MDAGGRQVSVGAELRLNCRTSAASSRTSNPQTLGAVYLVGTNG